MLGNRLSCYFSAAKITRPCLSITPPSFFKTASRLQERNRSCSHLSYGCQNSMFHRQYFNSIRSIHFSHSNPTVRKDASCECKEEISSHVIDPNDISIPDDINQHQSSIDSRSYKIFGDIPGATNTKGKKLAIIYTCKICNTRSVKQFTEQAYNHGVVLVRCPTCENLHLIADRLGMFEDRGEDGHGWDVQTALSNTGEALSNENVMEFTVADVHSAK